MLPRRITGLCRKQQKRISYMVAMAQKAGNKTVWRQKMHYHMCNSPPLVSILSQVNPVHALSCYLFKNHFNILLPSMPMPSNLSHSFQFSHQNYVCISFFPPYMPHALSTSSSCNLMFRVLMCMQKL